MPDERGSTTWIWQAATGLLLVVLLGLHIVANHFSEGGLLSYDQVVHRLSNPFILVLEIMFLGAVIFHAFAGIRSILLDTGISEDVDRTIVKVLAVAGVLLFLYGFWIFARLLI